MTYTLYMVRKVYLIIGLLVFGFICMDAQLVYPIVGTYKGKSAQDMAIYGDKAYLMNDGGHCRVLNLEMGIIEKEMDLACSNNNTHINNVCFGVEVQKGADIPLIYVSETNKPHRCFVEDINGDKPVLLQTIEAFEGGKNYSNHNWVVDRDKEHLYGLKCYWHQYLDKDNNIKTVITKYRLPKLIDGEKIELSEKDILDRFDIYFPNTMQGATIKKGKMYIASGMQERERNNTETERAIIVIDLKKKIIKKRTTINFLTTNEPEGIDFDKSKCLLFCGQTGGVYLVKL